MQKLTLALAVLALGLGTWQTLENQTLRGEVEDLQAEATRLRGDLAQQARQAGTPETLAAPDARLGAEPAAEAPAAEDDGPTLLARGASPEVIAKAVRDLQARVASQETRVRDVEAKVDAPARTLPTFRRPRFLRSVDDATRELDLDATQRADFERIVEYAKQDLERLWQIPNEDGKTLKDVQKPITISAGENGGFSTVFTSLQDVSAFKNGMVPGRGETYAEAESRIRADAKREIRDLLNPTQQKTWDESYPDPLFGSSGPSTISIGYAVTTESRAEDD